MQAAAVAQVKGGLNKALKSDAARFNPRQPKGGFLSIAMKVDSRPQHVMLPPTAKDPLQTKIGCQAFDCRYAVIGAAYFCPACGHSAAEQVFGQTIGGIRQTLAALDQVRAAMPDRDAAEIAARLVIENSVQNAVTAFQRVVEALYEELPSLLKASRNAFQNLSEGSALWLKAPGRSYSDHLDVASLADLGRTFQQQHLLTRRQGLVDQEYVTKSGDNRYRPGQRLVVRPETVTQTVGLIEALVTGLRADATAIKARYR